MRSMAVSLLALHRNQMKGGPFASEGARETTVLGKREGSRWRPSPRSRWILVQRWCIERRPFVEAKISLPSDLECSSRLEDLLLSLAASWTEGSCEQEYLQLCDHGGHIVPYMDETRLQKREAGGT